MSDFERYCLREGRTCAFCGQRGMHTKVKVKRLVQWAPVDAPGWQCEGCGSVVTDVASEIKARRAGGGK